MENRQCAGACSSPNLDICPAGARSGALSDSCRAMKWREPDIFGQFQRVPPGVLLRVVNSRKPDIFGRQQTTPMALPPIISPAFQRG